MAKIRANGAKEVCRFKAVTPGSMDQVSGLPKAEGSDVVFVLTDDGRVLRKWPGLSGYSVYGRIRDPDKRTAAFLRRQLTLRGYRITEG